MQIAFAGRKCPAPVLAYAKNYGNQKARSDAAVRPGSYTTVFNRGFLHDVYVIKLHLGFTPDSDSIRIIPVPAYVNAVFHLDFPGGHAIRNVAIALHAPFDTKIGGHAARGITSAVHAKHDMSIGGHAAKGITSAAHAKHDLDIGGHAVTSRTISSYLRYDISLGGHALLAATRMQRDIYDIDLGGHAVTSLSKIAGCCADLEFGGHAIAASNKVFRAIYDMDIGGHACTSTSRAIHAIYDLLTSSHALPTKMHTPHIIKDMGFGGHAVVSRSQFLGNMWDLSLGGHATIKATRNTWVQHDISFGGHAMRNARRLYHTVKDMVFGGHAHINKRCVGGVASNLNFAGHATVTARRVTKIIGVCDCVAICQAETSSLQFTARIGMIWAVAEAKGVSVRTKITTHTGIVWVVAGINGGFAKTKFSVRVGMTWTVAGVKGVFAAIKHTQKTGMVGAVVGVKGVFPSTRFTVRTGMIGVVVDVKSTATSTRVELSIVWGHFGTYTYGDTISGSLIPSRANIDGDFTCATSTPNAGTTSIPVTFTPEDTVNYAVVTVNVPIIINKKTLDSTFVSFTLPDYRIEGQNLSGYKATTSISGITFTYHTGSPTGPLIDMDAALSFNTGLSIYAVPSSIPNYILPTVWDGIIVKGQIDTSTTVPLSITYGTPLNITGQSATHNNVQIPGFWTYSIVTDSGQETFISSGSVVDAGNYIVKSKFIPFDLTHYEGSTDTDVLGVGKATQAAVYCAVSGLSLVVGRTTIATESGGSGTGEWVFQSSNTNVVTVSSSGAVTAVGVGTASISAQKSGDANYTGSVWSNWSAAITVRAAVAAYVGGSYHDKLYLTGGSGNYGWSMTGGLNNITIKPLASDSSGKHLDIQNVTILPHCYAPNGYFRIWDTNDPSNVLIFYYSSFFPLATASINGYTPIPACADDPLVPPTISLAGVWNDLATTNANGVDRYVISGSGSSGTFTVEFGYLGDQGTWSYNQTTRVLTFTGAWTFGQGTVSAYGTFFTMGSYTYTKQ